MKDLLPNDEDKALIAEATYRAVAAFKRKAMKELIKEALNRDDIEPLEIPRDLIPHVLEQLPALKAMVDQCEIACANARAEERERCAKIADVWATTVPVGNEPLSPAAIISGACSETGKLIALQIRAVE